MQVIKEVSSYYDFKENSWSCDEVWEKIEELDLEDEAIQTIESYMGEEPVDETGLNDFIRYELWDIMDLDGREEEEEE